MKYALLPLAAAATAIPRIELNLDGVSHLAEKLDQSIYRAHDLSTKQPDGTNVLSRQDWTERCPAGTATTTAQCPFPLPQVTPSTRNTRVVTCTALSWWSKALATGKGHCAVVVAVPAGQRSVQSWRESTLVPS